MQLRNLTVRKLAILGICCLGIVLGTSAAQASEIESQDDVGTFEDIQLGPDEVLVTDDELGETSFVGFDASGNSCQPGNTSCDPYEWHLMPQGLIYRQYMAAAKQSRFRSVWHDDKGEGDIWDITLGGEVGLIRYGTRGNGRPMGVQLGIEGAAFTRLDLDMNNDVVATDYRFGIPLTWGDAFQQFKMGYYHLSSHLGDEFLLNNNGFPRLNYSRDTLILGYSIYPHDLLRLYTEVGYNFESEIAEQWEFQFGIDYGPTGFTGIEGAPFAAANGHLREEVDYGGNFVVQAGWAWRRAPASGMLRLGAEYFNGKSDQFSFYDYSEQKVGFGIWYDY